LVNATLAARDAAWWGPARSQLRAAFNPSKWMECRRHEPDRVQTRYHDDGAPAWFATIKRIQTAGLAAPVSDSVPSLMPLQPGMRVLDLGCGTALTSIFLAREFDVEVWATDLWVKPTENWERIHAAGLADQFTQSRRMLVHSRSTMASSMPSSVSAPTTTLVPTLATSPTVSSS
jgi:2-polyprenyl-3-methyl-5-hydroxy-6-metoxy-1,4-benzoquinol methylase